MPPKQNVSVEDKYQGGSVRDAILVGRKGMWAGSQDQTSNKEYVMKIVAGKPVVEYIDIVFPPALYKIFDEVLVNAVDHNNDYPNAVTHIDINLDPSNGVFTVFNNGPGIEIVRHNKAKMWVPEFIFGEFHATSNLVKDSENTKGGTNGLGAKLTNVLSTQFTIETVDSHTKQKYTQTWRNNMSVKEPPVIVRCTDAPYTMITFLPDYKHFHYTAGWTPAIYKSIIDLIRMRMYMIASAVSAKCEVKFNGDTIRAPRIYDIAKIMFPTEDILSTSITPKPKSAVVAENNAWEVCIVITDRVFDRQERSLSNINGTIARRGKHVKHLSDLIYDSLKAKLLREFKKDSGLKFHPSIITNNIFMFINARIPGGDWSEQKKHEFEIAQAKLVRFNFTASFLTDLYDVIKEQVIAKMLIPDNKRKRKDPKYDKYEPAQKLGQQSTLLIIEGDSAMTQVRDGISDNPKLGFTHFGMISTGGVILNAFKNSKIHDTTRGRTVSCNKMMDNNEFLQSYLIALGINVNYAYDPASPSYVKEMSELSYGQVAICTDQDLDGFNINSLLLVLHERITPNLLRNGYVKRFDSPVIRAYANSGPKVFEFYIEQQYKKWCKTHDESKYMVKYYKGLATHNKEETVQMFMNFHEHLYDFGMDDAAEEMLKIYYDNDTAPRKVELAKPLEIMDDEDIINQSAALEYAVSSWLKHQTKEYQLDNIQRKLNHVIDGSTESSRKIQDGVYKAFKTRTEMKVAQLAGFISEHENYHHGEAGLATSIVGKAFTAVGGKQLPQILPNGNFGSRNFGGKDAGAPRYIHAQYNRRLMDLLYPTADYYRLDFTSSEGDIGEPKFFVPIIPTVLTESAEIPGTGWKLKMHARDVFEVISNARRMIMMGSDVNIPEMSPAMYRYLNYTGDVRTAGSKTYSFGNYIYNEKTNTITITELPLGIWTDKFVSSIKKNKMEIIKTSHARAKTAAAKAKAAKAKAATAKTAAAKAPVPSIKIIKSIKNNSSTSKINIIIKLYPNALNHMQDNPPYTDKIEEYFNLRTSMNHNINLIGVEGNVLEFALYTDVFNVWFPVRKHYYKLRIDYDILVMRLKIKRLINIIRYVNIFDKLKIPKKTDEQATTILTQNKFDAFDSGLLDSPKHTPIDELENLVLRGKNVSYNYLLATTDAAKLTTAIAKRKEKLQQLNEELEEYIARGNEGSFCGAQIWLDELTALEKTIKLGQATDWHYKKQTKRVFT